MKNSRMIWRCCRGLLFILILAACRAGGGEQEAVSTPAAAGANGATDAPVVISDSGAAAAQPPPITSLPTPRPTPVLSPPDRLAAARENARVGSWEAAYTLYESLTDDPVLGATAGLELGDLYLRDERQVDAAVAWQAALRHAPEGPWADGLRYRLARGFAAVGEHGTAIALWQQVDEGLEIADDVLAARLAASYDALGDEEAATAERARIYESPLAGRVERALAANQVGRHHLAAERPGEAILWFERSLELSLVPSFRAGLIAAIGEAAAELGDTTRQLESWQRLVEDYPETPEAIAAADKLAAVGRPLDPLALGDLYFANGRYNSALRLFYDSLEVVDRAVAHDRAAASLAAMGQYASAMAEWQKIVETHPEAAALHPEALLGIGRMAARLGRNQEALATWERIVSDFPESDAAPSALWEQADLLDTLGDPGATDAFERLAARYPEDSGAPLALWRAGMTRYLAGDPAGARVDFEQMAALDSDRAAQGLFWAGKAARRRGQVEEARRLWETAAAGDGYYALRAADLLSGRTWSPRTGSAPRSPAAPLDWLAAAAGMTVTDLSAPLDDPYLARGDTLMALGERDAALDAYLEAIRSRREEIQPLWVLSHALRERALPSYSILAATRLMDLLGYTPATVPPALGMLVYPLPYPDLLAASAAEWEVDPLFFAALIYQESRWEPRARSHAAARGLTQVIPATGSWIAQRLGDSGYRYTKLDRPLVSLRYGGHYLNYVLGLFDDDPFSALAAYNGGPGNAARWQDEDVDLFVENISLSETRSYVELIYDHHHAYERLYRAAP